MNLEWDGKIGPAFVAGLVQLCALLIGGAALWTHMQDNVQTTQEKVDNIKVAIGGLRTDLKTSQAERAQTNERLGRVETSITFLTSYFQNRSNIESKAPLIPYNR